VTLKGVVPKAACDSQKIVLKPGHECTGENQPVRAKESLNKNLMRLSEQSLELVSVLKKQAETSQLFFCFTG
jgi:hypothetical protein